MKLFNVLVVAAMTAACGNGAPAENAAATADESKTEPAVVEAKAEVLREVTIPAGTTLRLKLQSAVASDSSEVEDTVRAELRQAVSVEGQAVLPVGTEVVGTVTDVERSGRVKGRAHVAYRFSSLRAAGERYNIKTTPLSHTAAATKGNDAKKIGIGAGAGAAVGALLGGGSGAAKGAVLGGAGGTGVVLATRGKEVHVGPGAEVTTKLTAPLVVRVPAA
jgi:hypothetical protein